jgi:hypothetical protein
MEFIYISKTSYTIFQGFDDLHIILIRFQMVIKICLSIRILFIALSKYNGAGLIIGLSKISLN